MKAVVYDHYGPPEVLHIAEVPKPAPAAGEVLVRVRAAAVTRADAHTREANRGSGPLIMLVSRMVSGLRAPRQPILGSEFAGEIVEVGAGVKQFAVGDEIFGSTGFRFGAHAEFMAVPETARIAHKPAGTSFVAAAPVGDGGLNSLWCLKVGNVQAGESVLVYGASGAIGTAAVQLCRNLGAHVTAVCNTKNVDLIRSLGAQTVIDYLKEDFTKNGVQYDVIFDAVGKKSFLQTRGSLKPGGRYLATDGFSNLVMAIWTARFGDKKSVFKLPPRYTREDVHFLQELIEAGKFRAVIDRTYPLEQVVEATRYVETQQKTGNVVLTIGD